MSTSRLLDRTRALALAFLDTLPDRPVASRASRQELAAAFARQLPEDPEDPLDVIEDLAARVEPGLVASAGPRYFGFVTGGSHPAALAADWLVSAWDQNAAMAVMSPAVSVIEDVTAGWLLDLLGLPATASVGFVTGAHTANITALAAARHEVLRRAGWDVEANGLQDAPRVHVAAGADAHVSIDGALRLLGLGTAGVARIAADDQGRMRPDALDAWLDRQDGPTIVCAQAGDVSTGACDPIAEIAARTRRRGAWLHVDGAFGLWAAASPARRHLVAGIDLADSWTTDAHKWLNVPYDSGIVAVAHPAAHRAAMSLGASYLMRDVAEARNGMDWVPEASRRARVVPIYATLRSLGRRGVTALIDRCCDLARRIATRLETTPGVHILNDVVLNQVLVRFESAPPARTNLTEAVLARVQREGVCWMGGTRWQGAPAMRISVSGWRTTPEDADRSADAILDVYRSERGS